MMRAAFIASLVLVWLTGCSRPERAPTFPSPTKSEVWKAIQPMAERYRIDPAFIYALVAAESNFNAAARNGEARGLMQIKPLAWRAVSSVPYDPNVWAWQSNLEVGVDYLAHSRSYLHAKTTFSYPLLLAAFHFGLAEVEARGFDAQKFEIPDNVIYRELWQGNLHPVATPDVEEPQ